MKSAVIPVGTTIGYQKEKGSNYESPIKAKKEIIRLERIVIGPFFFVGIKTLLMK